MNLNISQTPNFSSLKTAFPDLKDQKRWVVSNNKKIPLRLDGNAASCTNPEDWATLSEVLAACQQNSSDSPAISLYGTDLCILDLDHCVDENARLLPEIRALVDGVDSYTEISRSGKGLHIIVRGKKPGRRCKNGNFEMYDGADSKFITLTGNLLNEQTSEIHTALVGVIEKIYYQNFPADNGTAATYDGPKSPPLSNNEIIELLRKANNGVKFELLFDKGDVSGYGGDDSAADLGLCSQFAFYTQDPDQVFALFKESALYKNRPDRQQKWDREDYRTGTIRKAICGCTSPYQPIPGIKSASANGPVGTWESPARLELGETLDSPFPLDALPGPMQEAVREVERSVQVDPSMAMVPALGMTALQIGKKVIVVEKKGLEHHPSLFLACVMDQVERKSETSRRILDPIKDLIEEREQKEYKTKYAQAKAHNKSVEQQIAATEKLIRDAKQKEAIPDLEQRLEELIFSKVEMPAPPKNWGDDITPQKLQQNLRIHGGAYGLFSSEGRTIFHRILDKKDTEGASNKSIYTSATWGDDLERSRVGSDESGDAEEFGVRRPALTITVFIQKDLWTDFARDKTMRLNGTISRICVVNPPSRAGTRLEHEQDEPFKPEKVASFAEIVMLIRKWNPEKPVFLQLSQQAARARRDFYNGIEQELGSGGRYEDVRDIAGRACSLIARIAGIFSVFDAAAKGQLGAALPDITEEQWLRAQQMEEYFLAQAIDFQRLEGRSGSSHLLQKAARFLLRSLKNKGSRVLLSEMRKGVRGLDKEKNQSQVVDLLERAGWLRQTNEKVRSGEFAVEINERIAVFDDGHNE